MGKPKPKWAREKRPEPKRDPADDVRRLITRPGQQESDAAITARLTPKQISAAEAQSRRLQREIMNSTPEDFVQSHLRPTHSHHETEHLMDGKYGAIDHVLTGRKKGDSVFRDRDAANDCITEICYANSLQITKWMQAARHGETREFSLPMFDDDEKPDYIGDCFVSTASAPLKDGMELKGFRTNIASVVLRKDDNRETGWYVETAYPKTWYTQQELDDPGVKPDFQPPEWTDALHKSYIYQSSGATARAYMDLKCSGQEIESGLKDGCCRLSSDRQTMLISGQNRRELLPSAPRYELTDTGARYSMQLVQGMNGQLRRSTVSPVQKIPVVIGVDSSITDAADRANQQVMRVRTGMKDEAKQGAIRRPVPDVSHIQERQEDSLQFSE